MWRHWQVAAAGEGRAAFNGSGGVVGWLSDGEGSAGTRWELVNVPLPAPAHGDTAWCAGKQAPRKKALKLHPRPRLVLCPEHSVCV